MNYPNLLFLLSFFLFFGKISFAQAADSTFKLCGDEESLPYYSSNLRYIGGFWEIKNHFKQIEFVSLDNNSGIVTIQFAVNCNNEVGRYTTQSCDLDYLPNEINPLIIDKLLLLTKELKNWIAGKDEEGNFVNSHAFLSFRIENGAIIEILPK